MLHDSQLPTSTTTGTTTTATTTTSGAISVDDIRLKKGFTQWNNNNN